MVPYTMVCLLLFWGCTEKSTVGEDVSETTGSISFSVVWQAAANNTVNAGMAPRALTGNPCQDYGITWIVAKVYNESDILDRQSDDVDIPVNTSLAVTQLGTVIHFNFIANLIGGIGGI